MEAKSRNRLTIQTVLEKTILNRELFCIGLLVYSYVLGLVPIAVSNQGTARYVLAWAAVLLLYDLFTKRFTFRFYGNGYLIAFMVAVGVTYLVNGLPDISSGLADAAFIVVLFFLFYTMKMDMDREALKKFIRHIAGFTSFLLFGNTVVSFWLLWNGYSIPYLHDYGYATRLYYIGISREGRFCGPQGNPNLLGWFAMAGFVCTVLYLLLREKRGKLAWTYGIVSCALQWVCVALSESRGALVALYGGAAVSGFLYLVFCNKIRKKRWPVKAAVFIAVCLVCAALMSASRAVGKTTIGVIRDNITVQQGGNMSEEILLTQREFNGDLSTGRLVLMKTGLKAAWNENIILGVGAPNAPDRWLDYKPADFAGETSDAGNMHNLFVQLILNNGIVGLLLVCLFLWYCISCAWRAFFRCRCSSKDRSIMSALLFGISSFGLVGMVDSILIYPYAQYLDLLFFLFLGGLIQYIALSFGDEAVRDPIAQKIGSVFHRRQKGKEEDGDTH
ncbi:O-antigen ligase family protein [Bittarella massiliensis (ex Durand et al. 2017)]|uniref:O-antigen ligase family protein n=1 Tax=Bittarella massiliensis (ex Durand et al. 2017) TaxID=1720313 RepID=UPI00073F1F57|nr:O-antigen ligase family protein [Bittarella massiliensis (ex Durand et al. 2017)]